MIDWVLKCFSRFWGSVAASVDEAPISAEEKNRLQHYTAFLLLGIPTMVVYGLYNLAESNYLLCVLVFASGAGLSVGWLFLRKLRRGQAVYRINCFLFGLLILYMLVMGGEGGSKILWMYTFPLIAFFLLGKREGLFWSVLLSTVAVGLFWTPVHWFSVYPYHEEFKIRFATTFLIVSAIAYWLEYLRDRYRTGMESEQRKLEGEQERLKQEIEDRRRTEQEKELLVAQLQKALEDVKTLSGFIPSCSYCHNIRDDEGFWNRLEAYIQEHSDARFSHGICPDCAKKHHPEIMEGE